MRDSAAHLAVIFHRFGPYHHARLTAAGRRGRVTGIELSERDDTYEWDRIAGAESFSRISLFQNSDILNQSTSVVVRRVTEALDDAKPDVVAIPGWSMSATLVALSWCVNSRTPAIVMSDSTFRDEPRRRWKEGIKRRVVRMYSAALVGGTPQVDYLVRLGLAKERIFAGYDVVDNAYFAMGAEAARRDGAGLRERLGLPPRYFLASNRFIAKKNLPMLLRAFAIYRQQAKGERWKLVMLGDGPLRPELLELSDALGLSEQVIFAGFRQYPDLPAYYGLAGAFIHSSTSEQWGLVVNEAMAAGLPVIVSTHCGCTSDLVRDGRNGFTFDPRRPESLVTAMIRVAADESGRAAMGHESRKIIDQWSPESFASGLWASARSAIESSGPIPGWLDQALLWGLIRR